MNAHDDEMRMHVLTSRLCDGEISSTELVELDALLDGNEAAAKEYLALTSIHLGLERKLKSVTGQLPSRNGFHRLSIAPAGQVTQKRRPRALPKQWMSLVAIAACLMVAVTIMLMSAESAPSWTARIVQTVDCDWDKSHWSKTQAEALSSGQEIKFNQGLMMLEFGDGAEVCLEGPVRFKILANDRGQLDFGKLTATVPERGHGFEIQMPTATVIDLGTRFGAIVTDDSHSETHVFEGSVLVRARSNSQSRQWMLRAGSALRIASATSEPEHLTSKPGRFVHASKFEEPDTVKDTKSILLPTTQSLVLWLDAAKRLQFDDEGKIVGWGDLCSGENIVVDNAWQSIAKLRPAWSSDAMDGRPAVHFNGTTYLLTTPFASASDVTIFCVFRSSQNQSVNARTGQIINLNGPPNLVVECTSENRLIGRLAATLQSHDAEPVGWLEASLPDEDKSPVVAAYVYGHSSNRSLLFLNGKPVGEGLASIAATVYSPKVIGMSNSFRDGFVGDLSELLVFNSLLSADQCAQISANLMDKYDVDSSEREPRILSKVLSEKEE